MGGRGCEERAKTDDGKEFYSSQIRKGEGKQEFAREREEEKKLSASEVK